MKKLITLLTCTALLTAGAAMAGEDAKKASAPPTKPSEFKNQTHCPVMGGKIDSTVFTDIQGQRVYHCCPGCSDPLKKDPDKYFKKAAAEGILFENIQTADPICGMKPAKEFFLYHEGRGLYFCNEGCKTTFAKDAAAQLAKMLPAEKEDGHDHDHGHDHEHDGHSH